MRQLGYDQGADMIFGEMVYLVRWMLKLDLLGKEWSNLECWKFFWPGWDKTGVWSPEELYVGGNVRSNARVFVSDNEDILMVVVPIAVWVKDSFMELRRKRRICMFNWNPFINLWTQQKKRKNKKQEKFVLLEKGHNSRKWFSSSTNTFRRPKRERSIKFPH